MSKIVDCGVIYDIEPGNFYADGSFYVNENLTEKAEERNIPIIDLISKRIDGFSFDRKIQQIVDEAQKDEVEKIGNERTVEITDFFKENNGKTLDIVFFPDFGLRGTQKVILEENSIFYISLASNLKIGFFINKTLSKILFKEGGL